MCLWSILKKREEHRLVDKELFDLVNRLARTPVGERKVPLYRKPVDKKNAFKVINGKKSNDFKL
ncbi:hypothetical protein WQ57_09670 [Mesobacillus campisalis]|uniref:Uncharacterized protein n=1 Tax=Mesobacillus campisalis TaxID=1408103 RepID=A0A0M2SZQ9_9BACI|nr:hypothetical protein WQ57_09670 [Mesobacillus campisalis]